jgi:hypothetical protein
MIKLYRTPDSSLADEVEAALQDMVIAHEVVAVGGAAADAVPAEATALPALVDDGEVVTGEAALRRRLESLRSLMNDWDRFQSDACYIEDDGTVC